MSNLLGFIQSMGEGSAKENIPVMLQVLGLGTQRRYSIDKSVRYMGPGNASVRPGYKLWYISGGTG